MVSKHTPGPWRLNDPKDHTPELLNGDYRCIGAGVGYCMPDCPPGFSIVGALREADARLMVAAPDLLEVLKESLPFLRDHAEDMADFAAQWPADPDGPGAAAKAADRVKRAEAAIAKAEGR